MEMLDFPQNNILMLLGSLPDATAVIEGSENYPNINGTVRFYQTANGVLVWAEVFDLPYSTMPCKTDIFAFHLHSGESCTGNANDPFADALTHYDPDSCPHPAHAGDMPPLFGNMGFAFSAFLTDRFTVDEIIGKTVIIHSGPDDFYTQPSGNSGKKVACGVISPVAR